jgi:Sugar-specific transcriptional regulator TrmB
MPEGASVPPGAAPGRAAHLRALGFGEAEEEAYELLLSYPHGPADRLAAHWHRGESLAATLAELADRGLAERLPGDPAGYRAVPPGVALDGHLTALEDQFKAARDRVTELALAYHRQRAAPDLEPGTVIEVVTGRAAVLQRIEQIRAGARGQVRSLDEAPYVSLSGIRPGLRPLPADVTRRVIYDSAAIGDQAMPPDVEELLRGGQQARVLPSVPLRLHLVDRRLAVLPLRYASVADQEGEPGTLIIVHPSALLEALSELFENLWTRALPVSSGHGVSARHGGQPTAGPEQPTVNQRLITLLLAGLTDTASARHLGVSQRTVQRRVATLLGELGVQTRFQAGAKLAFRDTGQPLPHALDERPAAGRVGERVLDE